jgi:hypothetical protein
MHESGSKGAAATAVSALSNVAKFKLAAEGANAGVGTPVAGETEGTGHLKLTQEDRFPPSKSTKRRVPNTFAYWAYRSDQ